MRPLSTQKIFSEDLFCTQKKRLFSSLKFKSWLKITSAYNATSGHDSDSDSESESVSVPIFHFQFRFQTLTLLVPLSRYPSQETLLDERPLQRVLLFTSYAYYCYYYVVFSAKTNNISL